MSGKIKQEAISWIKTILLAVILAGAVNSFLIVNAEVPTGSMENTIMTGDHILALRTSYGSASRRRAMLSYSAIPMTRQAKFCMSSVS